MRGAWCALLCHTACLQDPERAKEVGDLLGEVQSEEFAHIVALGKMMVDFAAIGEAPEAAAAGAGALDDDIGVAVEFEDEGDDDDADDDGNEVLVSTQAGQFLVLYGSPLGRQRRRRACWPAVVGCGTRLSCIGMQHQAAVEPAVTRRCGCRRTQTQTMRRRRPPRPTRFVQQRARLVRSLARSVSASLCALLCLRKLHSAGLQRAPVWIARLGWAGLGWSRA